jgi:hypothetical protein
MLALTQHDKQDVLMKKLFSSLDLTLSRDSILNVLYEKISQVKAIVECLLLAILSMAVETQCF